MSKSDKSKNVDGTTNEPGAGISSESVEPASPRDLPVSNDLSKSVKGGDPAGSFGGSTRLNHNESLGVDGRE